MSKAKKVQSSSQQRTLWQETWRRFKKNKLAVAGMIFLIALVVIAIATIIIDAVNPSIYETYVIKQNLRERLAPPSAAHIFGQDEFGRDMLIRILWSIRSSLFMGALSIALSCIVGGLFGAIAGYYGGKLDNVIMRIMDVFLAIPSMLLAIAIVAAFGTSLVTCCWPSVFPMCRPLPEPSARRFSPLRDRIILKRQRLWVPVISVLFSNTSFRTPWRRL